MSEGSASLPCGSVGERAAEEDGESGEGGRGLLLGQLLRLVFVQL